MTLWGGVFRQETDELVRKLSDSLPFDWRLYDADITGSQAWSGALTKAGILTEEEHLAIVSGLEQVRAEFSGGTFQPAPGDEDIHTAVERRLTELIGEAAGKLHTGRSRNDQVATDFRLWVSAAIPKLAEQVAHLQSALIAQAEQHVESVMPGITHFRPAQPITAGHWLMQYAQMLERDRTRLGQVKTALGSCPLGSAALAGTPYPIDRADLAASLGFDHPSANSLDAVSDRDYVAGFLYVCSLLTVHLSRMAEEFVIFSHPQFGYISLSDSYSTGSSIMPQKRNPDPLEQARGKAGRIIGHLTGFLTMLKGLPSGYNKDFQEDKEPVFDTFDTLSLLLPILTGLVETMALRPDKMRAALDEGLLATDLADYLALKGMPFRQAHSIAGQAVRLAEEKGVKLSELPLEDYQGISDQFTQDIRAVFDFDAAVARRKVFGGTAPEAVRQQIAALKARIKAP